MGRLPHTVEPRTSAAASRRRSRQARRSTCVVAFAAWAAFTASSAGVLVAQIRPDTKPAPEGAKKAGAEQGSERSSSFPGLREAGESPAEARTRREQKRSAAAQQAIRLVRLDADIALREVPAAESPVLGEPQKAGQYFVKLGDPEFGHVPVGSLTGFVGYVHSSFFREIGDGWGATTGTNVSFRVRPRSGEPPLWAMPARNTKLAIEKRDGEWFRVLSAPSVRAWLPVGSVESAGELAAGSIDLNDGRSVAAALAARPEVLAQVRAHLQKREALLAEHKKAAAEAAMRKAAADKLGQSVETVRRDYQALIGDAAASADPGQIDALLARVKAVAASLATAGAEDAVTDGTVQQVEALQAELERRRILAVAKQQLAETEAIAKKKAAEEKAAAAENAAREAAMTKRANRRTWNRVGWIEFRPGATDYRPYRLMKGGRTIAYLECSTGRYDLSDFTGREVGLIGDLSRPDNAELRVLDVERLVILSSASKR